MTLEELNALIDKSISSNAVRPGAMETTNALNAEYALGAIFAYIDIIWKTYGIDAMIETKDRVQGAIDELTERTQILYKGA
jgi:hypothetical protein